MNREDRAKQFLPFEALNGLGAELRRRREKAYSTKKRLISEEKRQQISEVLSKIEKGSKIDLIFYNDGKYISLQGRASEISFIYKYLQVGDGKIYFDDIYDVEIIVND